MNSDFSVSRVVHAIMVYQSIRNDHHERSEITRFAVRAQLSG